MPKGVRSTPCPSCGSRATNCACARAAKERKALPAKKAAPVPKERRASPRVKLEPGAVRVSVEAVPPLSDYSVGRLVELQHQVVAELRARRDRAKAEALAIDEALHDLEVAA